MFTNPRDGRQVAYEKVLSFIAASNALHKRTGPTASGDLATPRGAGAGDPAASPRPTPRFTPRATPAQQQFNSGSGVTTAMSNTKLAT